MAGAFFIDVTSLLKGSQQLKELEKNLGQAVDEKLTANVTTIATTAKTLAARFKDNGGLEASINPKVDIPLEKHVTVNANYAAFVEFGTGKYAAAHIGTLPADWQAFAASFRRQKGSGTAYDFFLQLIAWVKRHSQFKEGKITGTHSAKTGRRTGNKSRRDAEDAAAAYLIMRKIFRDGVKAQPFLYPAYDQQREQIKKDVETVLKSLA